MNVQSYINTGVGLVKQTITVAHPGMLNNRTLPSHSEKIRPQIVLYSIMVELFSVDQAKRFWPSYSEFF